MKVRNRTFLRNRNFFRSATTNGEIASAVILSLEESLAHNKEQVCDLILHFDFDIILF